MWPEFVIKFVKCPWKHYAKDFSAGIYIFYVKNLIYRNIVEFDVKVSKVNFDVATIIRVKDFKA